MILCVVGPTAVGKTKLSIELAKKYNAIIINCDAMQVYKGLDIGTAKVTKEEMEGIPHKLLDFVDVNYNYTVFDYQKDARAILKDAPIVILDDVLSELDNNNQNNLLNLINEFEQVFITSTAKISNKNINCNYFKLEKGKINFEGGNYE